MGWDGWTDGRLSRFDGLLRAPTVLIILWVWEAIQHTTYWQRTHHSWICSISAHLSFKIQKIQMALKEFFTHFAARPGPVSQVSEPSWEKSVITSQRVTWEPLYDHDKTRVSLEPWCWFGPSKQHLPRRRYFPQALDSWNDKIIDFSNPHIGWILPIGILS